MPEILYLGSVALSIWYHIVVIWSPQLRNEELTTHISTLRCYEMVDTKSSWCVHDTLDNEIFTKQTCLTLAVSHGPICKWQIIGIIFHSGWLHTALFCLFITVICLSLSLYHTDALLSAWCSNYAKCSVLFKHKLYLWIHKPPNNWVDLGLHFPSAP